MAYTSDIVNEYLDSKKKWNSNLSKFVDTFFAVSSPNWVDTASSMLINLAKGILKQKIQDAQWNKQIELCIRAADTATMSQDQITLLLERITERLRTAEIDTYQFILDKEYIGKLANNLAGNDGGVETERLSAVLSNVLKLLSTTLYSIPEFNIEIAKIVRQHESNFHDRKHDLHLQKQVLDDHED